MPAYAHLISSLDGRFSFVDAGLRDGRRQYAVWRGGAARLFNDLLEEKSARVLEPSDGWRLLAARGLEKLVIRAGSDLLVVDHDVVTVPDLAADAAAYLADRLLVTAPAGDGHRVLLIEPATGAVLAEALVDADDAVAFITPHPTDPVAVIDFGMGQDGCLAIRAEVDGDSLRLVEVLAGQDPVIAGFSPSGDRLLVVPHPNDPDAVRVLAWPSLDELGRLTEQQIGTELGLGLPACWVDEDRIASYAVEDSLVISDGRLGDPERVPLPVEFGDHGELESLLPLAPGRVAAGVWTPEGHATLVLEF